MKVFYRISPYLSTHPNPLGSDKIEIVQRCWMEFPKEGHEVIILNDSVPKEYLWQFKQFRPTIIDCSGMGNMGTFHKQLELVSLLPNDEKVFLVEDDYLWEEDALLIIEEALDQLDLISPYDHPGHYFEDRFKNQPKRMCVAANHVFREAPSNTLTFACKAHVIKQHFDLIKNFGLMDHEMFQALPVDMWVPVPSLATHLVEGLLAPGWDLSSSL